MKDLSFFMAAQRMWLVIEIFCAIFLALGGMMERKISMLLATAAALSVAGCTSSSNKGGLISASEEVLRVFADTDGDGIPDQDFGDVLDGDNELVAREVSEASWRERFLGAGSYALEDGSFSIRGDGDDLLVTVLDQSSSPTTIRIPNARSIGTSSVRIDNTATGGFFFDMFVGGGLSVGDLLTAGNGYAVRVGVFYSDPGADNAFGTQAVLGAETQDAMIDMLQSSSTIASYTGFASLELRRADAGFDTFNANLSGDLSMTANFGAGSVSGSIGNLSYEERAGQTVTSTSSPAGSITMRTTEIRENAFSGTMRSDTALTLSDPTLGAVVNGQEYSGAFYGPAAEEVGGTMQGSATVGGVDYLGIGSFTGN